MRKASGYLCLYLALEIFIVGEIQASVAPGSLGDHRVRTLSRHLPDASIGELQKSCRWRSRARQSLLALDQDREFYSMMIRIRMITVQAS